MDGCGVVVVIVVSGKREEGRKQNKKEKEKKKESIRRYWWWHCSWCGRELRRGLVGGVVEEIFFSSPWFGLNFCALSLSLSLSSSFSLFLSHRSYVSHCFFCLTVRWLPFPFISTTEFLDFANSCFYHFCPSFYCLTIS